MSDPFQNLVSYTQASQEKYGASASALFIIQDGHAIREWYSGQHHFKSGALPVTRDSMFNLYSIRKSYVGMATAIAVTEGNISIDTVVSDIVKDMPTSDLKGVTIRDLATKTNAKYFGPQRIEREEVAGKLIKAITGKTISQLITERVFKPLELNHSEWVSVPYSNLVCDFQAADGYASIRIESDEGHDRNLYASAKDLAMWGYLHLLQGAVHDQQLLSNEVFRLINQLRAETQDQHRIFGWYFQEKWFYASGAAGCHCVVIPEFNAVGVRMLNKYTENYSEDQTMFNETFYECLGLYFHEKD
ncbi:serine hydrolase domain-containing protein [Paenibacillus lautus]|uniref:serine hydrolase domain-containing protein n=1 Tax=Paenibacillus lautus TaxID=1401 RepID=UPI003D294502